MEAKVTTTASTGKEQFVQIADCKVRIISAGSGDPLLLMHHDIGSHGLDGPFIQELAKQYTIDLPTHPGYDMQDLPGWARHPRDLAVMHLWLLNALGLENVHLLGLGFGGWIAAEMASMDHQNFRKLALVGPMGIQPREGEILDEYIKSSTEFVRAGFHDQTKFDATFGAEPSIDQLEIWEINREMTTRIAWKPYMFNQSMPYLAGSISVPTLLLWGKQDAVVPIDCAKRYEELIPNVRLELIDDSGHYPDIEQPANLASRISGFLSG